MRVVSAKTFLRPFLAGLLLLLSALATSAAESAVAAQAAPTATVHTDFSGDWKPQFDRWQGLDELLKLQQANWVIRRSVGTVPVVERATQKDGALHVEMLGPIPSFAMGWFVTRQMYLIDNQERLETSPLGVESMSRHYWHDANTLAHAHKVQRDDGLAYEAIQYRTLHRNGMEQRIETIVELEDGETLRALQIYSRNDGEHNR